MKFMKWKSFFITSFVTLLPILLGVALWDSLPDSIAIHFNVHNQPDNFASKPFAVFGLPALMVLLQFFSCFIYDINAHHHGERIKFERVTKWIIPVMSIVLQIITLGYSLGWDFEVHRVVSLLVGGVLVVTGNYLPKFDQVKNFDVTTEKAKKINRFIGFETVVMGLLFIIGAFFPPTVTVWCLILMIPYAVIALIYSLRVARK